MNPTRLRRLKSAALHAFSVPCGGSFSPQPPRGLCRPLARPLHNKEKMNSHRIAEILVDKGKTLFDSPRNIVTFTGNIQADNLLNDLENTPHAFVLACVMDRQIKAKLAWLIPYLISEKLGNFNFQTLAALSLQEVENLMTVPSPLHRFPSEMSKNCNYSA